MTRMRSPALPAFLLALASGVPAPGPVNTFANAWLEWDAGRNILGLKMPWCIGVPSGEFVREFPPVCRAGFSPSDAARPAEAGTTNRRGCILL